MFSIFDGQEEPGANCPSHDGACQEADEAGTHRHPESFPSISRGIAVRFYVCGQCLSPPASLWYPRQECGRYPRGCIASHCRHGRPTSFLERQRNRIHETFIRGILQKTRAPTRVVGAVYAPTKWSHGERTLEPTKQDTRRVWEFRTYVRTSA